jgi:hypothetical protein
VSDELVTLAELFTHPGFLGGLFAGSVALITLFLVSRILKSPVPGWALALAIGAVTVLMIGQYLEWALVLGIGLVAVAGAVLDLAAFVKSRAWQKVALSLAWVLLLLAAAGSAWLVELPGITWVAVAAPVAVLGAGAAIRQYRGSPFDRLLGPMLALSVLGIWATVPETDMIRVVLGTAIVMALATLPPINARPIGAGAFSLASLLIWLTAFGGATRPGSIIAGWACLGVLVLIPLLGLSRKPIGHMAVVGTHLIVIFVASRLMGSWESTVATLIGIVALLVAAAGALLLMARSLDSDPLPGP